MRHATLLSLVILLSAAPGRADAIKFEQIPADATSYFHFDLDRWMASRIMQQAGWAAELQKQFQNMSGGQLGSITVYTLGNGEDQKMILMAHGKLGPDLSIRIKTAAAGLKDSVIITLAGKDVYYSSASMQAIVQSIYLGTETQPIKPREQKESNPSASRSRFSMGVGGEADSRRWTSTGPSFIAPVGLDTVIATTDLSAMAEALDVLAGNKPSLATSDPHGIKMDLPPGVTFMGVGVNAELDVNPNDASGPTTQPMKIDDAGPGRFGMNLFGTLHGKVRLARFDSGENDQSEYADASFGMVDSDSATQLKNLILGIKALVSLSQADQEPLIEPLDVQADGKTVTLHWSWPAAKLSELLAHTQGRRKHDDSTATRPSTQPNP
ncbi:MAG: hypothetical protein ABSG31_05745 [Tepidisphaeraceae bacterium]|jgi:hypothetical protein